MAKVAVATIERRDSRDDDFLAGKSVRQHSRRDAEQDRRAAVGKTAQQPKPAVAEIESMTQGFEQDGNDLPIHQVQNVDRCHQCQKTRRRPSPHQAAVARA